MKSPKELQSQLLAKIKGTHPTFKETYGSAVQGTATVLNEAFVIDRATRDRLVKENAKSADILKPYAQGQDLKRWLIDQDRWLIHTPKGKVNIDDYPAVKKHLLQFKDKLEQRAGDQKWFELEESQPEIESQMREPKISFSIKAAGESAFLLDPNGTFFAECGFFVPGGDYYLTGLLNSSVYWALLKDVAAVKAGEYEFQPHHVETLPIPDASGYDRGDIGRISDYCHRAFQERNDVVKHFQGMTKYNLSPQGVAATLSEKLEKWYLLSFSEFRAEIISCFGQDIPAADLELWDGYLKQEKDRLQELNTQIAHVEAQLNQVVYRIFGLSEEEIALIERP